MSTPSPFQIGQAVGSNVSGGIRGAQQRSMIDDILEQANSSEDPNAINNAIGNILRQVSPERQEMALQVLGMKQQQIASQRRQQALQSQGLNPEIDSLDPGIQKELIKKKGEASGSQSALQTLARMREIQKTGHLGGKSHIIGTGRKAGSTFNAEGQRLRSEYERLGKSLIQSSTNIPIRNKQEFETLAHDLYDASKSNEEILGTLDAMERIIRNATGQNQENEENYINQKAQATGQSEKQAERPPLDSFYR